LQKSVDAAAPARRPAHQRPAVGARALAMRRASRASTLTTRTSPGAAAQARAALALAPAPLETGRSCVSQLELGGGDIQPENRFQLSGFATPAVTMSGAVSPMTRAMAMVTPGRMPDTEVGSTIFMIVFHFGTPRA